MLPVDGWAQVFCPGIFCRVAGSPWGVVQPIRRRWSVPRPLVSAIIGRDVQIIYILTNEPAIDSLRDRQLRFDINCRAGDGELVNVEMSLDPNPFEPVRLEFHAGKLFIGQDIRGTNKTYNDLKRA